MQMDNSIIKEEELIKLASGIKLVKAHIKISGSYAMLDLSPLEFLNFCKANNIQTVFYEYLMYEKEKYIISDEIIKNYTNNANEYNFCKKWVDEHNLYLQSFDFTEPEAMLIAASFKNMVVSYSKSNKWLPEEIKVADDALIDFMESHEDELIEFYKSDDNLTVDNNPYKELENVLLSDKKFRQCTNAPARHVYFKDFIRKDKNKKFLLLFRAARTSSEKEYRLANLFDQIYNEYRNNCYKTKTLLGDPLPNE